MGHVEFRARLGLSVRRWAPVGGWRSHGGGAPVGSSTDARIDSRSRRAGRAIFRWRSRMVPGHSGMCIAALIVLSALMVTGFGAMLVARL
jgi:hypothetical protein